mgnify:CR=1 FL=1|jgi:hypothetical protein|nr:MAG TPA: hypothetical protein [Caudoviricetes sp.]
MNNGSGGIAAIAIALTVIMFGGAEFGLLDGFKDLAEQVIKAIK